MKPIEVTVVETDPFIQYSRKAHKQDLINAEEDFGIMRELQAKMRRDLSRIRASRIRPLCTLTDSLESAQTMFMKIPEKTRYWMKVAFMITVALAIAALVFRFKFSHYPFF